MGESTPRGFLPVEWLFEQGSVELWRELCAPLFDVSQIHSDPMMAELGAHIWRVGPFMFWRSTCGGQILHRRVTHLTQYGQHILVSRHMSGRIVGTTDCDPFQASAGEIAIRHLGYPFSALQYPSVVESILIPCQFVDGPQIQIPTMHVFEIGDPAILPLQKLFATVFGALRASTESVPVELVDQVIHTVRDAKSRPSYEVTPRRAARQSQRSAIQAYIEQNLGRLDLSADTILPHFGVSRATLYRLFEPYGGVRNYIVDRRLFHALVDISDSDTRRGKIQLAAKRWGFSSAANFNRSVQHTFGGAPGSLFKLQPMSSGVANNADRLMRSQEVI